MSFRQHRLSRDLAHSPEEVFSILVAPSAIRSWWGAASALVVPGEKGLWAAAWGDDEDDPDYVTAAQIVAYDPPKRLMLDQFRYHAKSGPLPFAAELSTEFEVEAIPGGARLTVTQDGFPDDPMADPFFEACETGWRDTLDGIERHLDPPEGD